MARSQVALAAGVVLLVFYLVLIGVLTFQVMAIQRTRSKIWSFQMGFCLLTLLECAFRSIFWLIESAGLLASELHWNAGTLILFWIPTAVQWSLFAFLSMFFVKMIWRLEWQRGYLKERAISVFVATSICHAIFSTALAIAAGAYNEKTANHPVDKFFPKKEELISHIQLILSGVTFLVLAGGLAFIGCTLRSYSAAELQKRRLPACVDTILLIIALVFLSRSIFDILSSAKAITVNIGSRSATSEAVLLSFTLTWEVAPVLLLLSTVAVGPPRPALSRFSNIAARLLRGGAKPSTRRSRGGRSGRAGGGNAGRGDPLAVGGGDGIDVLLASDSDSGLGSQFRVQSPGADSYSSQEGGLGESLLGGSQGSGGGGSYSAVGAGGRTGRQVSAGGKGSSSTPGGSHWGGGDSADGRSVGGRSVGLSDDGEQSPCALRGCAAGCFRFSHAVCCSGCCSDWGATTAEDVWFVCCGGCCDDELGLYDGAVGLGLEPEGSKGQATGLLGVAAPQGIENGPGFGMLGALREGGVVESHSPGSSGYVGKARGSRTPGQGGGYSGDRRSRQGPSSSSAAAGSHSSYQQGYESGPAEAPLASTPQLEDSSLDTRRGGLPSRGGGGGGGGALPVRGRIADLQGAQYEEGEAPSGGEGRGSTPASHGLGSLPGFHRYRVPGGGGREAGAGIVDGWREGTGGAAGSLDESGRAPGSLGRETAASRGHGGALGIGSAESRGPLNRKYENLYAAAQGRRGTGASDSSGQTSGNYPRRSMMLTEESSGFLLGGGGYDRRESAAGYRHGGGEDQGGRDRRGDSDAWVRRGSSRYGLAGYGRGGHGPSMVEDLDEGGPPPMPPVVGGWGEEEEDGGGYGGRGRGGYSAYAREERAPAGGHSSHRQQGGARRGTVEFAESPSTGRPR